MLPWSSWFKTLSHYTWHRGLDIWRANSSALQQQCCGTTIRTITLLSNKIRRTSYILAYIAACHEAELKMNDCYAQVTQLGCFFFIICLVEIVLTSLWDLCVSIWCEVLLAKHSDTVDSSRKKKNSISEWIGLALQWWKVFSFSPLTE